MSFQLKEFHEICQTSLTHEEKPVSPKSEEKADILIKQNKVQPRNCTRWKRPYI